jgi:DNA polymerase-3 subunit alpha
MGALYRPGPMEFIPLYIARKHGEEEINYMHPELYQLIVQQYGKHVADEQQQKLIEDLTPIMDVTYGIAVYQEQLMVLVQNMA